MPLAERLVEQLARPLRPPEVEAREHREDDRAEDDVVEVRDDEIRVGHVEVERRRGEDDTRQSAEGERDEEADGQMIGVSKVIEPRHIVPIQLKIFTPVGTAMSIVMKAKKGSRTEPVTYMWCAHTVTDRAAIAMVA